MCWTFLSVSYLSQERQASESQICKEVVAMVAGRRRHKRTHGREAIEGEEYFEEDCEEEDGEGDVVYMK